MVTTETITIEVPAGMSKYLEAIDPELELTRNALLLYPYILNQTISHGRAAEIIGIFPIPKSESKKRKADMLAGKILHTKKIDCDNLCKTVLDALNGIAYDDDKQVCRLYAEKRYGAFPKVKVKLKEIV